MGGHLYTVPPGVVLVSFRTFEEDVIDDECLLCSVNIAFPSSIPNFGLVPVKLSGQGVLYCRLHWPHT